MATLYEIDAAIMDCVDAETGEIIDEEQLTTLLMERSAKLEGVALWKSRQATSAWHSATLVITGWLTDRDALSRD